jgi:hypothetical protein
MQDAKTQHSKFSDAVNHNDDGNKLVLQEATMRIIFVVVLHNMAGGKETQDCDTPQPTFLIDVGMTTTIAKAPKCP